VDPTSSPTPISLRAYAKRRGVSAEAVSKAIKSGRLRDSVVMVGSAPKIADAELADREWEAHTQPRIDQPRAPSSAPDEPAELEVVIPDYNVSRSLREAAAARREAALADMAELEVAEKTGELVSVAEARADVIDKFTIVKTKILGVPSRIAQQLPALAGEVVPVVDSLLREALEELAVDDEPEDDGEEEAA
jgi:hypothetical protein